MNTKACALAIISIVIACYGSAVAQSNTGSRASSGKVSSGEAGYRMGCSAAAATGSQACAELWSDKQRKEIEARRRKREEDARRARQ